MQKRPLPVNAPGLRISTDMTAALDRPRPERLSDIVSDRLKQMLLDGGLAAGSPLSVVDIARQLGVSRQPVMEAIKRLEADELVEIAPQVGCRVRRPSPSEVEDFFVMFAAMEAEINAFAALRHTAEEAAELNQKLADLLAALDRRSPAAPPVNHRLLNRRLHGALHAMARAPKVTRLSSALWDRSDFYVQTAFGVFRIDTRMRGVYHAIIGAVNARDAEAARAATRAHLLASGRIVAARLHAKSPA
jgi:DNA-binding GntR family transcriptional regulator